MTTRLDADQLRELLAEQHEFEGLDFKSAADLAVRRDLVELVKDMAAMSAEGGYIVVGAADDGTPVGLGPTARRDFDEATIRGRVRRYLPDVDLRCAVHEIDGVALALMWIGPHPNGFAILSADGQYEEDGRQTTVFREADVLVRRGTASVRVTHPDMARLRDRFVEQERTRVRREWAADLTAAAAPAAERPGIGFEEELGPFGARAAQLVRVGDTVPIRLLLARIKPVVVERVEQDDLEGLRGVLDRVGCLLSLAILLDLDWLLIGSVAALSDAYEVGHEQFARPGTAGIAADRIWLEVALRVFAVGGLAVRQRRWSMVRRLALEPGDRERFAQLGRTWLRHALVYAARGMLLQRESGGRQVEVSVLKAAEQLALATDCLRPDERAEVDGAVLDSLCQFDALQDLATLAETDRPRNAYPSFGQFYAHRTEPAIERVIQDPEVRRAVAPLPDQDLADALRLLSRTAHQVFFMVWDGFDSRTIEQFLAENPPREPTP